MTQDVCPACKIPNGPGRFLFMKTEGVKICWECQMKPENTAKKIKRFIMRGDVLLRIHHEMRAAIDECNKFRREKDKVKDEFRCEVRQEIMEEIKKKSFFDRLRFLFNPFGNK